MDVQGVLGSISIRSYNSVVKSWTYIGKEGTQVRVHIRLCNSVVKGWTDIGGKITNKTM